MSRFSYSSRAAVLIAREKLKERAENVKKLSVTESYSEFANNNLELRHLPQPIGGFRNKLSGVTEVFISGAGGAGGAFIGALEEAELFGLDLKKLKVICGTSAGTIIGLGILFGMTPLEMTDHLRSMPAADFQDWSFSSVLNFFSRWGFCEGKVMVQHFKDFIKDKTGLDDPTFQQMFDAGYDKEFRVIVANVSTCKMEIWSYKTKPHMSVAKAVATSCNLPFVFPPIWHLTRNGQFHAYVDGGIMRHYPLRDGSHMTPPDQQLGFVMVNKKAAIQISDEPEIQMESFWDFLSRLFTMLIYRDPLCMDQTALDQTVAISVNHNSLKFAPTEEELRELKFSGRKAVREYIQNLVKNKANYPEGEYALPSPFNVSKPLLFQCNSCKALESLPKIQENNKISNLELKPS